MTLLEVWHLKIFLTLLGGFRVQHVYGNHNQVGRSVQEANQNGTSDLEWKKQKKVGSVITKEDLVSSLENRYSCWLKLKSVIAFILKWKVNHHRKHSMLTGETIR